MKVAIVVFEGFNELDTFASLHMINRVSRVWPKADLTAELVAPSDMIRSMFGVEVRVQRPLSFVHEAAAVIVSSGGILAALDESSFIHELRLEPTRQLIASQCSGALMLSALGLLAGQPACVDSGYRSRLEASGTRALDQPFFAEGNVATAGGCFASAHLSTWITWRLVGREAAALSLAAVAPVGEQDSYVRRVMDAVGACLSGSASALDADLKRRPSQL
ncbi:MAG: DJ/PfpI family protein [Myxococcaceae bacterium]|nr:DJ/PfpI family protein [Myxococcaceae bacterium]